MTYRIPSRLAHYETETEDAGASLRVYLRHVPGGPTLLLVGVGALIWQVAADGVTDVAVEVADLVGHPLDVVGPDIATYLESLVSEGLLEQVPAADGTS